MASIPFILCKGYKIVMTELENRKARRSIIWIRTDEESERSLLVTFFFDLFIIFFFNLFVAVDIGIDCGSTHTLGIVLSSKDYLRLSVMNGRLTRSSEFSST